MKIDRIRLCYPDGDRIIVDKESDLSKYDLSKCSAFEVVAQMSREEFDRLRAFNQTLAQTGTSANVVVDPEP